MGRGGALRSQNRPGEDRPNDHQTTHFQLSFFRSRLVLPGETSLVLTRCPPSAEFCRQRPPDLGTVLLARRRTPHNIPYIPPSLRTGLLSLGRGGRAHVANKGYQIGTTQN